jgi:hypothetical protein
MPERGLDSKAASQAAVIVIVALGAVYTNLQMKGRPADAAQLRIFASRLQSQAAEATVLANQAARGDVRAAFAARHAAQLEHQTATTSEELTQVPVRPEQREVMATLRDIAANLDEQLAHFQTADSHAEPFDQLAQRAQAVGDRLAPAAQ